MTRFRLARIFWIGAAAILVVAALVALVAVLRGDFSDTDGRILGTLAAALLAGSTVIASLALVDRENSLLGRVAVVLSPPAFGFMVYAIWDFVFDGGGDSWRYGWTGALVSLGALVAVTARLLARAPALVRLAHLAGVLAVAAAATSIVAMWQTGPSSAIDKLIAVLWILTGLCYFLGPVLQRFTAAGALAAEIRVLGALDGVELVASRGRVEGIAVEAPSQGERLALRRRA